MNQIFAIAILLTSLVLISSAIKFSRKEQSPYDFFLVGGNLKIKKFIGTLISSNLSLGNMIFVCAIWGYFFGWSGVFWVTICIALLTLGFFIFGKYFKHFIEEKSNSGSIHEYISQIRIKDDKPERYIRLVSSFATVICLVLAMILELHLGANLLSQILNINLHLVFVFFAATVTIYSSIGGFRSVIKTDIIQAILMLVAVLAGIVFFNTFDFTVSDPHIYEFDISKMFKGVGWYNAVGISILGFFWLLVTMDTWQRNAASRSLDVSIKGSTIGGILLMAFVFVFAFLGMSIKGFVAPNIDPGLLSDGFYPFNDWLLLSTDQFSFSNGLLALVALGLVMAAFSTADTFLIVVSHSIVTDMYLGVIKRKRIIDIPDDQNHKLTTRARIVVISLFGLITIGWIILKAINFFQDPIGAFFVVYSVQFALTVPVLIRVFKLNVRPISVLTSLVFGIISTLLIGFRSSWLINNEVQNKTTLLDPEVMIGLLPVWPILFGLLGFFIANIISPYRTPVKP